MITESDIDIAVVGMGRTGTTLVKNILTYTIDAMGIDPTGKDETRENFGPLKYFHWKRERPGDKRDTEKCVICRRDFRDVLASGFRSTIRQHPDRSGVRRFIESKDNPCPENYKKFKVMSSEVFPPQDSNRKYFIPKDEILEQGKMIIDEGWYKWLAAGVDYIFHYEAFMKNKEKVITEMLHKLDISGFTAKECIEVSDEWLRNNPRHASNNGIINGWKDVFSPTQEQLIIDEFGGWMKEYNYIK